MFPITCKLLWTGLGRVLVVVGIGEELSSGVIKSVSKDPVTLVVGNGVANPLDMVGELAFAACAVIL